MGYNEYSVLVKRVLTTDDGKALFKMLMDQHVFGAVFSADERETAYKLGRRDLILDLLAVYKTDSNYQEFDYLGDF